MHHRSHGLLFWIIGPLLPLVVRIFSFEWRHFDIEDSSLPWSKSVFRVDLKCEVIYIVNNVEALVWVDLLQKSLFLFGWWLKSTAHDFNLIFHWAFFSALGISISEHVLHFRVGLLIKSVRTLESGDFTGFHLLNSHIPALCNLEMPQFEGLWGSR